MGLTTPRRFASLRRTQLRPAATFTKFFVLSTRSSTRRTTSWRRRPTGSRAKTLRRATADDRRGEEDLWRRQRHRGQAVPSLGQGRGRHQGKGNAPISFFKKK